MTIVRSQELQPSVVACLHSVLATKDYQELFICVGRDYLRALSGYETLIPSSLITRISQGGLGKKLSELHDWLYGKSPEFKIVKSQHRHPRIKGIEVTLTPT